MGIINETNNTYVNINKVAHEEKENNIRELPLNFYSNIKKQMKKLENELKSIENVRSIKYKMLEDEISSLEANVNFIFMRRILKIVNRSISFSFSNQKNIFKEEYNNLNSEEKIFYNDIIKLVDELKNKLIKNDNDMNSDINRVNSHIHKDSIVKNNNTDIEDKKYITVRILKNIPEFQDIEGTNYSLSVEDIVMLPVENAKILVSNNAASYI